MRDLKNCPLCQSDNLVVYKKDIKDFLVTHEYFSISKCIDCEFVFTNPRPHTFNLGYYYKSNDYISHNDKADTLFSKVYYLVKSFMLQKKIKLITKYTLGNSDKKLFDYGCGTGEFLVKALEKGYNCTGYEPDLDAGKIALDKGLNLIDRKDNQLSSIHANEFDVVTLWHVLEHIDDFDDKVKKFYEILKEQGVIVIAVPLYQSFDARFYDKHWAAYDAPRHLNHFDVQTIVRLFENNGFNLIKKVPLVFDAFYISILTEKVKNSGFAGFLRAVGVGAISNIFGLFGKSPYSSEIFIFKKQ